MTQLQQSRRESEQTCIRLENGPRPGVVRDVAVMTARSGSEISGRRIAAGAEGRKREE